MMSKKERNKFHAAMSNALLSDIDQTKTFPQYRPLLSHYTTIDALVSMIQSDEIWLSSPFYTNDHAEVNFGFKVGRDKIFESKILQDFLGGEDQFDKLEYHFDAYKKEYEDNYLIDTYVGCFCEHDRENNDGVLSMWRGYGENGKGVAVVFDSLKITTNKNGGPLWLSGVDYMTEDAAGEKFGEIIQNLCDFLSGNKLDDNEIYLVSHALFHRLLMFSLFTKHEGFSEEREWRMVYLRNRDEKNKLKKHLSYTVTDGALRPCLKLNMKSLSRIGVDESLRRYIDKIIMGPSDQTSWLAKGTLMRVLEMNGYKNAEDLVQLSGIPFRSL